MGKVTTYCLLSGCTPESADRLQMLGGPDSDDPIPGQLALEAIKAIMSQDEVEGQEDMTVIGVIGEDGKLTEEEMVQEDAMRVPASALRVVPHCKMGSSWYYGFLDAPQGDVLYPVSYGTGIMVQTASLPILSLSTGGRMTPQRLWRLAMSQGRSEGCDTYVLDGIDYGEVVCAHDQTVHPVPGLHDLLELETLSDVELAKQAIIHKGKFWIWMRPDRFPLQSVSPEPSAIPTVLEPPVQTRIFAELENLPLDIMLSIIPHLPLLSVLFLVSASHKLRSDLLGPAADRDTMARVWMKNNAPWYIPTEQSTGGVGWVYLQRCVASGSMRNRRRIWRVAERLEMMADALGI